MKIVPLVSLLLVVAGCAPTREAPEPQAALRRGAAPSETVDDGALDIFRASSVDGAFVLRDERRGTWTVVNPALASRGFLPASTFKIPNTLIGLETGVIPNERFALPWNGAHYTHEEWNRDQDLASAMRVSCVWFYREVARRIGEARMQRGVDAFAYGNRDISGGIDEFWLEGALRITAREQVEFLHRLRSGALPVSREHRAILEHIITLKERPGVVFKAKTGLADQGDLAVGWLVGWVERDADTFVFATLLLAPIAESDRLIPLRKAIARKLLVREGALPADMAIE